MELGDFSWEDLIQYPVTGLDELLLGVPPHTPPNAQSEAQLSEAYIRKSQQTYASFLQKDNMALRAENLRLSNRLSAIESATVIKFFVGGQEFTGQISPVIHFSPDGVRMFGAFPAEVKFATSSTENVAFVGHLHSIREADKGVPTPTPTLTPTLTLTPTPAPAAQ